MNEFYLIPIPVFLAMIHVIADRLKIPVGKADIFLHLISQSVLLPAYSANGLLRDFRVV